MSGTPAALRAVSSVRYSGTLRAIFSVILVVSESSFCKTNFNMAEIKAEKEDYKNYSHPSPTISSPSMPASVSYT